MSNPSLSLWMALLVSLLALTSFAQPRCKAPKKYYRGKCRYSDQIERLKNQQSTPAPTPTPKPHPTPSPDGQPSLDRPDTASPPPAPTQAPDQTTPKTDTSAETLPNTERSAKTIGPTDLAGNQGDVSGTPYWGWQRVTALSLGGLGILSAAVGTGLTVDAKETYDAARCPDNECVDQTELDQRNAAFDKATGATVALVLAAGTTAGALTLWLLAPNEQSQPEVALAATADRLVIKGVF